MNHEKQFPDARRQQLSALAIEALQADARTSERRRNNNNSSSVLRGPPQPRRSVSMRSLFSRSGSERKLSPKPKVDSSLDLNHHSSRLCRSRSLRHMNRGSATSSCAPHAAAAAARSSSPSRHVSDTDSTDSAYGKAKEMYKTVKDCLQEDEWFEDLLKGAASDNTKREASRITYSRARQRALQREMTEVHRLLHPSREAEEIPATPVATAKATLQLHELADQQESPTGVMDEFLKEVANLSLGDDSSSNNKKAPPSKRSSPKRR